MSDTTLQNCKCCEIEDDCINGLCQLCSEYNHKLQKQSDLLTLGILQEKTKYDTLKASHEKLVELNDKLIKRWIWSGPRGSAQWEKFESIMSDIEQALAAAEEKT